LLRDVQTGQAGGSVLVEQDPSVAAFAAASVQQALIGEGSEEAEQNLNVLDAGVDGGGKVFFVAGGFVEAGPYLAAELLVEYRGAACGAGWYRSLEYSREFHFFIDSQPRL
jgi:hypothetical protein